MYDFFSKWCQLPTTKIKVFSDQGYLKVRKILPST